MVKTYLRIECRLSIYRNIAAVANTMAPEASATEAAPLLVVEPAVDEPEELVVVDVVDVLSDVLELALLETVTEASEDEPAEPEVDDEPEQVETNRSIKSWILSVPTVQSPRFRASTAVRTCAQDELAHILASMAESGVVSDVNE